MSFSEDVKKNYIASGSMWCPKCGCSDLESREAPQVKSNTKISMTIKCRDPHCGAVWEEIFILSDIKEI